MKNVDVEIYLSQFISFFEKNPNDLMDLIGDTHKEEFYKKVKEQCQKNLDKGDDVTLTRQQILDIVINLKKGPIFDENKINAVFEKTKFGLIPLN